MLNGFIRMLRANRDSLGDQEGPVKANTELTNNVHIFSYNKKEMFLK